MDEKITSVSSMDIEQNLAAGRMTQRLSLVIINSAANISGFQQLFKYFANTSLAKINNTQNLFVMYFKCGNFGSKINKKSNIIMSITDELIDTLNNNTNVSEDGSKKFNILLMFPDEGVEGLTKCTLRLKGVDYYSAGFISYNICRLPLDINNDDEIEKCANEWVYPEEWIIDEFEKMRNIDYSKYDAIIVWNDMTPHSLMFLYTICKFARGKIYENNVSSYNMCPVFCPGEPKRNYDNILNNIRLISSEQKEKFIRIYDSFAGMKTCAKIAKDYDIFRLDDSVIKDRILKHSKRYKSALRIAAEAQQEVDSQSQDFIIYHYYGMKIFDYVLEGLFDVKQTDKRNIYEEDVEPYFYNGIDISIARCYSIKQKKMIK